jgi:hypothetical protein
MSYHYANIAEKLNQPILAAALRGGFSVSEQIRYPAIVWEGLMGPIEGIRFVGGYYSKSKVSQLGYDNRTVLFRNNDPFDLGAPSVTFFGLEENIFEHLVKVSRRNVNLLSETPVFDQTGFFYSGTSVLKDGSIISPTDFLQPRNEIRSY